MEEQSCSGHSWSSDTRLTSCRKRQSFASNRSGPKMSAKSLVTVVAERNSVGTRIFLTRWHSVVSIQHAKAALAKIRLPCTRISKRLTRGPVGTSSSRNRDRSVPSTRSTDVYDKDRKPSLDTTMFVFQYYNSERVPRRALNSSHSAESVDYSVDRPPLRWSYKVPSGSTMLVL